MRMALSLGVLLLCSLSTRAEWLDPYTITTIEASDTGIFFYKPADLPNFQNTFNCANPMWMVFDPATPLASRALSVGLTAQATGKKIKLFTSGCFGNWIKATIIEVDPNW